MTVEMLESRVYLIGGEPRLVVYSDVSEALEAIEIRSIPRPHLLTGEPPVRIFILGGALAERVSVEIPRHTAIVFSNRYVVITADNGHRYGEWYGKAQSVTNLQNRQAVIVIPGLVYYNRDFVSRLIFRPVLDRLLFECGYIPIHAAGVVSGKTGCILVGKGGYGKSTLLCGLLDAGMNFLADDRILLTRESGSVPRIHAFPEYIRLPGNDLGPKQPVIPPDTVTHKISPDVILFLEKEKRSYTVRSEPIGNAEAAARLLQFTPLFMENTMRGEAVSLIGDICESARAFLVTGWGSPQDRLKRVLEIIGETTS